VGSGTAGKDIGTAGNLGVGSGTGAGGVRAAGSTSAGSGTSGRGLVEGGNLNSGSGTNGGKVSYRFRHCMHALLKAPKLLLQALKNLKVFFFKLLFEQV
jgi:hypothetical protein